MPRHITNPARIQGIVTTIGKTFTIYDGAEDYKYIYRVGGNDEITYIELKTRREFFPIAWLKPDLTCVATSQSKILGDDLTEFNILSNILMLTRHNTISKVLEFYEGDQS